MIKIMLVEDDKSLREIYGVRLLAEGYEIVSAGDGEEALAMAVKEHPDLILSDVMMPKISGFDMLDILRATPETREIKVIMMTALSSEDQRARGEALGADRYLVKSQVGIEDVVRTIHEVLSDTPGTAATPATNPFGAPISSAAPTVSAVQPVAVQPASIPTQPQVAAPSPAVAQPQPITPPSTSIPISVQTVAIPAAAPQQNAVPAGLTPTLTPVPAPQSSSQDIIVPQNIIIPEPVKIAPSGSGIYHDTAPATAQLPQPTAPFSALAPTSLGSSVYGNSPAQPPTTTPAPTDFASLMSREISGSAATTQNPNQPNQPPQD